jgi:hypothetical protein
MWVGVCLDRLGAWAWVVASAKRVAKAHVRIYENMLMIDCACGPIME